MCDRRRDVIVSRAVSDKRSAVQAAQRRARDRAIRRGKQRTKRSVAPIGASSTTGFLGERLIDASTTHTHAAALC